MRTFTRYFGIYGFLLLLCMSFTIVKAQSIESTCTSITVTNVVYPNLYDWEARYGAAGCSAYYVGVHQYMQAKFKLLKKQPNATYVQVGSIQTSPVFSGLSAGTYRVQKSIPQAMFGYGCTNNEINALQFQSNRLLGVVGIFPLFSDVIENDITIGPTQPSDVIISVVSDGGIFARGFDEGVDVFLDPSASVNYTHYWLAIFEEGPTYNRFHGQGWTFGQTPATINLSDLWGQVHGDFEPGHEYTIQFALSNACNEVWTEPDYPQYFFICPSGLGCRYSEQNDGITPNFTMFPNPVSDQLNIISDLDFNAEEYSLEIRDISGRITYSAQTLDSKTIETSNFPNGFYIAMISKDNQVILTKKIIVQR